MKRYCTNKREEKKIMEEAERKLPGITEPTKGKRVIFSIGKQTEIFLVSEDLVRNCEKIKPRYPYSVGSFFGTTERNFSPSLMTLYKYAKTPNANKIVVNKKAEQHFLYGNNLEKQMVLSMPTGLRKGSLAVVCNEKNEALGLGLVTISPGEAQTGKLFVRNLKNISAYLRNRSI